MASVLDRISIGRVNPLLAYVVGLGLGWTVHRSYINNEYLALDVGLAVFALIMVAVGELAERRR